MSPIDVIVWSICLSVLIIVAGAVWVAVHEARDDKDDE